ncbi:hypothetical protein LTR70_010792, partial [Exophiala xenobiotica]
MSQRSSTRSRQRTVHFEQSPPPSKARRAKARAGGRRTLTPAPAPVTLLPAAHDEPDGEVGGDEEEEEGEEDNIPSDEEEEIRPIKVAWEIKRVVDNNKKIQPGYSHTPMACWSEDNEIVDTKLDEEMEGLERAAQAWCYSKLGSEWKEEEVLAVVTGAGHTSNPFRYQVEYNSILGLGPIYEKVKQLHDANTKNLRVSMTQHFTSTRAVEPVTPTPGSSQGKGKRPRAETSTSIQQRQHQDQDLADEATGSWIGRLV